MIDGNAGCVPAGGGRAAGARGGTGCGAALLLPTLEVRAALVVSPLLLSGGGSRGVLSSRCPSTCMPFITTHNVVDTKPCAGHRNTATKHDVQARARPVHTQHHWHVQVPYMQSCTTCAHAY